MDSLAGRGEAGCATMPPAPPAERVSATSLGTEGNNGKLKTGQKGTGIQRNARRFSDWRSGRAKRRFPLVSTRFAARAHPLHSYHVCLCPGTVSKLHAAWVYGMNPLPVFWLCVDFWGTAAGTYGVQGTPVCKVLILQPHTPQLLLPFAAGKRRGGGWSLLSPCDEH